MKRKSVGRKVVNMISKPLQKITFGENASEVRALLAKLYPGENVKRKYQEYQTKKFLICALVVMIGMGSFVCMQVGSRMYGKLKDGTRLARNEWGEGSYNIELEAQTMLQREEISYQVKERIYTQEELESFLREVKEKLPVLILGDNESFSEISSDLNLMGQIEGYPFLIRWKSSDFKKVGTDGRVHTETVSAKGDEVIVTAVFSYGENSWEHPIRMRLMPPAFSEEEIFVSRLQTLLAEADERSATQNNIVLPKEVDGQEISWKEEKSKKSYGILFLSVAAAVLCGFGMDRNLWGKASERTVEMERSYPELVSKMKLYTGAGLSVRNVFLRIGEEYRKERSRTGKKKYLYEEILISGYQLLNGKSEEAVYREWGKRCEVSYCRKLGFLLASLKRQGNEKFLTVLDKELYLALEEQKRIARKKGEEAGTKMLFPMLLQLLIVMFLILLPAFSGLQGV